MERGREERGGPPRPGPTPSSGRTGVTTPRRVGRAGEGCRAHANWRLLPSPSLGFLKLRPNLRERPPRCVNTHALLSPSCPSVPPTCNLEHIVWAGGGGGGRGNRLRLTGKWAERSETQLRTDWTRGTRLSPGLAKFDFLRRLVRPVGRAWRCNTGVEGAVLPGSSSHVTFPACQLPPIPPGAGLWGPLPTEPLLCAKVCSESSRWSSCPRGVYSPEGAFIRSVNKPLT